MHVYQLAFQLGSERAVLELEAPRPMSAPRLMRAHGLEGLMHWRLIGFRRLEPRVGRHGYCSQECEFYAALKGLPITDQSPEEVEADTQARLRERSAFALGGSWRREG